MKKNLIIITLVLAMGCSKEEPIEPIKENCVYDCSEIGYSQEYNQFILECNINDTTLQIFDFQYHVLKCE